VSASATSRFGRVNPRDNNAWSRVFDFGYRNGDLNVPDPERGRRPLRFDITTRGGRAGEQQIKGPANLPRNYWSHGGGDASGTQLGPSSQRKARSALNNGHDPHRTDLGDTTQELDRAARSHRPTTSGMGGR